MSQQTRKKKWQDILQLLKKALRHLFLHNGWVKLLALVISILLWAGLISQDPNVTRNKVFQNVNIAIQNSDSDRLYTNRGKIVTSDLDELLKDVTVTASVPQLQYENADASAYNLRIDLNELRSNGDSVQELRIQYDDDTTYGDVINISPSSIRVNVEELFTYQKVPITVRTEGETPEGWYMEKPTPAPTTVSVSGPISIVKEVSRGITTLDLGTLEWEEDTIRAIGEIKLINRRGDEIKNPLLVISSEGNKNDTVLIEASIMPTREYKLKDLIQIKGEPAEGYRLTEEPVFSPESITIAASEETLERLDEMTPESRADALLDARTFDITDMTETGVFNVTVKKLSLDNVSVTKPEAGKTVSVTVSIQAMREYSLRNMVDFSGELAQGYMIIDEPVYTPENMLVAGNEEILKALDEMPADERADMLLESRMLDLTGLSHSTVFTVNARELTMENDRLVVLKPDDDQAIQVSVVIAPIDPGEAEDYTVTEETEP